MVRIFSVSSSAFLFLDRLAVTCFFRRHSEAKLKNPRIVATTNAKQDKTNACGVLCIRGDTNAGVLRLRLRMTAKNKQQHATAQALIPANRF
jgi:hypothetical protein